MKKNLRLLVLTAVGFVGAVAFSSCAYDPYYTSVGGSYSTGYGDGYGYGGSSFNTSVFVGTGNPRWGYDPYSYSYYDYSRRAYYDPYLNGYYPVGYRPRAVYGVSHPYGWRPGSAYCRPPSRVTNVTIQNYRDRESDRSSGYTSSGRSYGQRPVQGGYGGGNYDSPSRGGSYPRNYQESRPSGRPTQEISGQGRYHPSDTPRQVPRYPSRYNTPAAARQQEVSGRGRMQLAPQATPNAQRQVRQLAPPDNARPSRQRAQQSQPQVQKPQPGSPQAKAREARNKTNGGGRWGGREPESN
jgi:hypothetical protein